MPAKADEPLRRVTLNLYEEDCLDLERWVGHGWTERVRQEIHHMCNRQRAYNAQLGRMARTLGDLE